MSRSRTHQNSDLPPYLYRFKHKDGTMRYRLKLETGKFFNFPVGTKKLHAINEAVNYNITYRSMEQFIEKAHHVPLTTLHNVPDKPRHTTSNEFNIPLEKALKKIYPLIKREELSKGTMNKYQLVMKKLCKDLGKTLTHDLNLQMMNVFLNTHYSKYSAKCFNNNLSFVNKAFSYLADQSYIPDNFMRNKKRLRVTKKELVKKRQRLTLEEFELIYHSAPLFLKVAMALTLETTHAINEICRIKYTLRSPRDNCCGIVWNEDKQPVLVDGVKIYGYLYIHRQKVVNSEASRVKIPVTQSICDIVQMSYTDRLRCPYIVHMKPIQRQRGVAKDCDHIYQVQSHYLSKQFSKVRDKVGVKSHLPSNQRPTYHEIRSLAARMIEEKGLSATKRMAHSNSKTTEIYTKPDQAVWNECEPISVKEYPNDN
ncbi:phage integrase Arm DNA-binding domain-containing protein [Vibrio cyclitrophicus]|uniref:phage integrase Arm DNA-binding domain-containing protein n=1 Tax=Vibrio cyclitrophicus TaxID=47951 RepID=UPI0016492E9F|nr:phage integrase Arm DNA-binding domain-containing protein [Vibrio cyclitrophicus]